MIVSDSGNIGENIGQISRRAVVAGLLVGSCSLPVWRAGAQEAQMLPARPDSQATIQVGTQPSIPQPPVQAAAPPAPFRSHRIAVRAVGSGPDVILIPGLASGPQIWNRLTAALPGYRYHFIHVRGFAGLPADLNSYGHVLAPVADEIARYIRETRIHAPSLIGHSMGGTLGMLLALKPQLAIARLMVVDMLPDGAAMLGSSSSGLGQLAAQLNSYLKGTPVGRQLLSDMVRQSPGGRDSDPAVISQSLADIAQQNLAPSLARLNLPLRVVYALPADGKLQASQANRFRAAYGRVKNAQLQGLGPSGHMIMQDQPARFTAQVRDFLGK